MFVEEGFIVQVILDMDPGIDDAIALLIALNAKLKIMGITTVSGNVDIKQATYNALRLLDATGRKITVAQGAEKPLFKRPIHSKHIHGNDGLGNCNLKAKNRSAIDAQKFFHDILSTHKRKEINILATGPLTNIALLLDREPLAYKLKKIVLMGGAYGINKKVRGNVTPYAEFNFYCDPEAADIVFNSKIRVDAVGLDVTMNRKCAVTKMAYDAIGRLRGKSANIAHTILSYPFSRYRVFHLHDVFALARLLHPNMFKTTNCQVSIDKFGKMRGRCVVTLKRGNVNVCSDVNAQSFVGFVMNGLRQH
jgi:inosine-uridine nucleoside N-ribohydrolase